MPLALALFFWFVAVATVAVFLSRIWWLPALVSAHGGAIDRQLTLTLIIAGIVFFLAQAALGFLIWRYRARGAGRAAYWHENPRLEMTWTVITALVFIGLGISGNVVWAGLIAQPQEPDAVMVEVTAQQFAWNFRYPGPDGRFGRTDATLINDSLGNFLGLDPNDPAGRDDITTQNILAVPVNRPVQIVLRSKDVTHAFYIPQMRVKQDAVPGMGIPVHFTAVKTGEYEIACAELCGMQHYKMRARLLVLPEKEYESWLKARAEM